ncbi:PEF-CTERM sorting domain-containing protein [Candidatus Pacearchaeota archaeon]|nr:PEF-CTERM sorting domain-containing protein [Candidatus Pacearchaeota archaeon]MBD3283131.1 PEF-CTERM sorting domain-containing protein [Candidatus Pacearchaeota archaeon]
MVVEIINSWDLFGNISFIFEPGFWFLILAVLLMAFILNKKK